MVWFSSHRERERGGERERERDRERERERQTDRHTETDRDRDRVTERQRDRECEFYLDHWLEKFVVVQMVKETAGGLFICLRCTFHIQQQEDLH